MINKGERAELRSIVKQQFKVLRAEVAVSALCEGCVMLDHQGGNRPIRPFGSLLWSQWPEVGIALGAVDEKNHRLKVGFYRGSRDERAWPEFLTRGTDWPWIATYPDNRWKDEDF